MARNAERCRGHRSDTDRLGIDRYGKGGAVEALEEEQFLTSARRIAEDQGIFTWPRSFPTDTPSIRRVELTVGDATLTFAAEEIAKIVEDLVH